MIKISTLIKSFLIFLIFISIGCKQTENEIRKPNVILIMADDIGFEGLGINGSLSYNTPNLDALASNGVNFTNAIANPLCTPSRVKIMTGKYNYKNYDYFTHLNASEKTFGNLFKDNGYQTAIVGKWQLNGLKIKEIDQKIKEDNTRPYKFGFDEYCLWQLTKTKDFGERFANPLIEQNGKFLERNKDLYGPDIVSDYAIDFIQRNKEKSFFLYYPMLLVHDPFVPTPDSEEWNNPDLRYKKSNNFFKDMVEYMDKIVGKIAQELKAQGIEDNTLIMFVGDNGTNRNLVTKTNFGDVKGAKGNTITHGVHVPMIASWPSKIKNPIIYDGVVDLTDFYATFSDILNLSNYSDGKSLTHIFYGNKKNVRETVTIYYDPKWSINVDRHRNIFSQDKRYKLYKNGEFFDMKNDILEENPLKEKDLDVNEKLIKEKLSKEVSKFPSLPILN